MTEREVLVRAVRWEADDVVSLELEAVDPEGLGPWASGAHVDLLLPGGRERQYSLCGRPGARSWRIAVLRERDGRGGSAWIHDELRPGATLGLRGPRNHFELVDAPAYLFVAGGIGITPILPMLRDVAAAGRPWRLFYGGRRRSSMAFLEELERYGANVVVAPQDEAGPIDLEAALSGTRHDATVYCCGPPGLLDAVTERCRAGRRSLRVERFEPVTAAAATRAGAGFEVHLQRSGVTVAVADGESILEAVETAGLSPPCSCLEGTCGSCETAVLEGDVDHRDSILTDAEKAGGHTMMICVSRAASPRLVLDL